MRLSGRRIIGTKLLDKFSIGLNFSKIKKINGKAASPRKLMKIERDHKECCCHYEELTAKDGDMLSSVDRYYKKIE